MNRSGRIWVIDGVGAACVVALTLSVYALGIRHGATRRAEAKEAAARIHALQARLDTLESQRDRLRSATSRARGRLARTDPALEPFSRLNGKIVELAEAAERREIEIDQIDALEPEREDLFVRVPVRVVGRGRPEAVAPYLAHLHDAFPDVAVERFVVAGSPVREDATGRVELDLAWYAGHAGADAE